MINKHILLVSLFLGSFTSSLICMEEDFVVRGYDEQKDREEVMQMLKDNWSSQVWNPKEFDQKFADILLTPRETNPKVNALKWILLARNKSPQSVPNLQGYITYYFFPGDEDALNSAQKMHRGHLELLCSRWTNKAESVERREMIEGALLAGAIKRLQKLNPKKIETLIGLGDEFSVNLVKKFGFTHVNTEKYAYKYELQLKTAASL